MSKISGPNIEKRCDAESLTPVDLQPVYLNPFNAKTRIRFPT